MALPVVTNGNLRIVSGTGWLCAEKQYADFILEVEWRTSRRVTTTGFTSGRTRRQTVAELVAGESQGQFAGALVKGYKTVVPAETPRMPLNKWVKFRLEVRGKKITLDVDGERAWEFSELDVDRGHIGSRSRTGRSTSETFAFKSWRRTPSRRRSRQTALHSQPSDAAQGSHRIVQPQVCPEAGAHAPYVFRPAPRRSDRC